MISRVLTMRLQVTIISAAYIVVNRATI
jgi:hypothetical protein